MLYYPVQRHTRIQDNTMYYRMNIIQGICITQLGAGCEIETVPNLMSLYVATRFPGAELAIIHVKMTRLLSSRQMERMEALHCGVLTSQLRNARYHDYESDDSITDVLPDVVCPDKELEEGEVRSVQTPPSRPLPKRTRRSLPEF